METDAPVSLDEEQHHNQHDDTHEESFCAPFSWWLFQLSFDLIDFHAII